MPGRERRIDFEGPRNFRDLGGYPTRNGGTTRWGVLYRADRLDMMTASDLDRYAELGIARVYDLRHDDERARNPDPVTSIHVPVMARVSATTSRADLEALVDADHGRRFMLRMMLRLLEDAGAELGRVIAALADPDLTPAVFHCTAGKDRTGVVAALILDAVGVEREAIVDDFALTDRYRVVGEDSVGFARMIERGIAPEAALGALGAPRSTMETILAELDRRWGGAAAYLVEEAGVDATAIRSLRTQLVH